MKRSTRESSMTCRRRFLSGEAAACGSTLFAPGTPTGVAAELRPDVPPEDYRVQRGRIKQSVYGWCFSPSGCAMCDGRQSRFGFLEFHGAGQYVGPPHRARSASPQHARLAASDWGRD
jgi:hypothetical protein